MPAEFPGRLRGEEIEGVDMVMLDADIAGCVSTWLSQSGPLDHGRQRILRQCRDDLQRVMPLLDVPEEVAYYDRLSAIAELVD
jgi:hypothetical protein